MQDIRKIWLWQRIVSPHMAGLAASLAQRDCKVTYVAEETMSIDRAKQGWAPPDLGKAHLAIVENSSVIDELLDSAPAESIHICQGIRSNGLVGYAQKALSKRGIRRWVVLETVDDSGWYGVLKRLEYGRLFKKWRSHIEGVLAIGLGTSDWVVARGFPAKRVFPFAYFLPEQACLSRQMFQNTGRFRIIFVGQFIERKRLDLLIQALGTLNRFDIELVVIGSGPLENELRAMAEAALPGCIQWIGCLPMNEVSQEMAKSDCLVLPSRHDGWGAVVSEALMVGTPAICSDKCGSAVVVYASGYGGVFRSGEVDSLVFELNRVLEKGHISVDGRLQLAQWAQCLGADTGAGYLKRVFTNYNNDLSKPMPPWRAKL